MVMMIGFGISYYYPQNSSTTTDYLKMPGNESNTSHENHPWYLSSQWIMGVSYVLYVLSVLILPTETVWFWRNVVPLKIALKYIDQMRETRPEIILEDSIEERVFNYNNVTDASPRLIGLDDSPFITIRFNDTLLLFANDDSHAKFTKLRNELVKSTERNGMEPIVKMSVKLPGQLESVMCRTRKTACWDYLIYSLLVLLMLDFIGDFLFRRRPVIYYQFVKILRC